MASDLMAWLGIRKSDSSGIDGAITWRPLIAEYLGTLLLVFMGTLLAVAPANVDPIDGNQGRANNARAYDEELRIGSGHRGSYEEKGNKY